MSNSLEEDLTFWLNERQDEWATKEILQKAKDLNEENKEISKLIIEYSIDVNRLVRTKPITTITYEVVDVSRAVGGGIPVLEFVK